MEAVAAPFRPSGARLALMAFLAVVAILAFLVLADVRLNPGDVWIEGVSDAASRSTMTTTLLVVEAIAFLGVLLLLLVRPAPPMDDAPWTSTGGVGDSVIQIGCPGCGTVFEKPYHDVDEPHEQSFRCPNCGRAGHLKMELHKQVPMHSTVCASCSNEFVSYRPGAECPRCHTPA